MKPQTHTDQHATEIASLHFFSHLHFSFTLGRLSDRPRNLLRGGVLFSGVCDVDGGGGLPRLYLFLMEL
jgi:hypothetical protein